MFCVCLLLEMMVMLFKLDLENELKNSIKTFCLATQI